MHFDAWALLPPVVAITAAVATRRVLQSLLAGIVTAGIMVAGHDAVASDVNAFAVPFAAVAGGFFNAIKWITYGVAGSNFDGSDWYSGHAAVIMFTVFLGGLVAIMQRAGGVAGFGHWFLEKGQGRRGGMLFASVGGMFLAIDDYFHVIAAGSVFRPVTDRLKISREKLSYLIDSTAAPMVILVPISTWAGYIIGEIRSTSPKDANGDPTWGFGVFLEGIPFNFYAILTIMFVVFIAATGTDFGPMAKAERRAMKEGKLMRDGATPLISNDIDVIDPIIEPKARNLVVPVVFLVLITIATLAVMGGFPASQPNVGTAIAETPEPELGLAISSFITLLFALSMFSLQGMKQDEFVDQALNGAKAMLPALAILAMAWGIGNAVEAVGLGDWLSERLADNLDPESVPLIAFMLAAAIAFATGTSFGTFALMIPIALPVAFATGGETWLGPALAASIGGAVFGDHCSPISDTTVLSSAAAQADHIDHVRTQLPYALSVAALTIGGYSMLAITGLAWVAWIVNLVLFAGLAAMTLLLWRRSRSV